MLIGITGISGLIGSALERRFINLGFEVKGLKGRTQKESEHYSNLEKFCKGVDVIIHCAAISKIKWSTSNKSILEMWESNVKLTQQLINAAKKSKVKRIIFLSSARVYKSNTSSPILEIDESTPFDLYGYSKRIAEKNLVNLALNSSIRVNILRVPNVYNGDQNSFSGVLGLIQKFSSRFGIINFFKNCNHPISVISLERLILVIEKILINKKIDTCVLNVADKIPKSLNQIFEQNRKFRGFSVLDKFASLFFYLIVKHILPSRYQRGVTNSFVLDNSKFELLKFDLYR